MKISTLLFGIFFSLITLSCASDEQEVIQAKEGAIEITKTTVIERRSDGTKRVCVTCSNGYKFCCDSPKSPTVNCVTKTGSCATSSL